MKISLLRGRRGKNDELVRSVGVEYEQIIGDTTNIPAPFFFWRAAEGTFSEVSNDYRSVVFTADPDTGSGNVRVIVGIGDSLGRVYRVTVLLKGNDWDD